MAVTSTELGEPIDVGPSTGQMTASKVTATVLARGELIDVVRLSVPAGMDVANHTAPGDISVHCLAGAVDFIAGGRTHRLTPGRLLCLPMGTLHALHGVEDAAILVTIARGERGRSNVT